jgi:hypothetical protein
MEATAKLKYARISPQKCRLVADTVRGAQVSKALNTLKFMPKKGADLVHKVLWSAVEKRAEQPGCRRGRPQGHEDPHRRRPRSSSDSPPAPKGRGTRIVKAQQSHHCRRRRRQEGRVSHGSKGKSICHSLRHYP